MNSPIDNQPIVTAIDHLVIRGSGAKSLFAFCTDVLQLPVAWPPDSIAGMPVTIAGVRAGNTNLEIDWSPEPPLAPAGQETVEIVGLVFQPVSAELGLMELDKRGINHTPPWSPHDPQYAERYRTWLATWTSLDAGSTGFTAIGITGFLDRGSLALCEYSPGIYPVHDELARRLEAADGGPLGLVGVEEVLVSVRSLEPSAAEWQTLLEPLQPSEPGRWRFERGPAIRMVPGDEARLDGLVLRARSIDKARAFLREQGLLWEEDDGQLVVDPARLYSLRLTVIA